jgi:hypothetical protein
MKVFKSIYLAVILTACGQVPIEKTWGGDTPEEAEFEKLKEKHSKYLKLFKSEQKEAGFIYTDKCDSLLFSSLLSAVGVPGIDVVAAEAAPGRWWRRPASLPECYSVGESRSTISRDMLLGVLWWAWEKKRLDVLDRLFQFGESRDWVMGDDSIQGGHTVFTPLLPLLARMRHRLGGHEHPARHFPLASEFDLNKDGFEAHLQVLQIILDAKVKGSYSQQGWNRLEEQARRQPNNPLFQFAIGKHKKTVELLLNNKWWPEDRLPTTGDRKEPWLLERDFGPDWQPSNLPTKQHSGGDFLFVVSLLMIDWKD